MLTRSIFTTIAAVLLFAIAAVPTTVWAAVDAFLYIDGVRGSSAAPGHKDEIEVYSWSFGVSNAGMRAHGTGGGEGRSSLRELTITKTTDASSAALMQAAATGRHFPEAKLFVRKAGGEHQEYLTYAMQNVMVTGVQHGGHGAGGGSATETVTFTYGALKIEYQPQKSDSPPSKLATPPSATLKLAPSSSPGRAMTPTPPLTVRPLRQAQGCSVAGSSPASSGKGWSYQLTSPPPTAGAAPILIRLAGLTASDHVLVTFLPAPGETITPLHVTVGGASALTPTVIAHLTEPPLATGAAGGPCWQAQISLSRNLP